MKHAVVCRCQHDLRDHKGGSCSKCVCFLWEPHVKLLTEKDLVEQAAKKGY